MAENESLDLGSSYSKRWNDVLVCIQNDDPPEKVAPKVNKALCGGIRKVLKQFKESGINLADLLTACGSRLQLRQLLRGVDGHQYAQLFETAAHVSRSSTQKCLRGWVEAVLDKVFDQICLRVNEKDESRSFFDLQEQIAEIRKIVAADVEHIVTNLSNNPDWRPQRKRGKAKETVSPTAEMMSMSLLGGKQP